MPTNKYSGLRQVTISIKPAGDTTRQVGVLIGNQVGSDGLNLSADTIEQTQESFAGTERTPVGVELKASTLSLIPYSIEDKGKMLPMGYDAASNTWNFFEDACTLGDATVAFERVCPNSDGTHGVNFLLRHAEISIAHTVGVTRDKQTVLQLSIYPHFTPASNYGITGANATLNMAWQEYYGVYNGTTDAVTYDKPASQGS